MKKLISFIKHETVLSISFLLAIISSFIVIPNEEYLNYIDFRTLSILFCLMAIMAGLQKLGLFKKLAQSMLNRVKSTRQLILILTMLCFIFSMIITNDVALITFVPFTFIVLELLGKQEKSKWIVPIVTMQTISANLGSMLTPLGNPQNLYLYSKSNISILDFILLMLPYTVTSLILIVIWNLIITKKDNRPLNVTFSESITINSKRNLIVYAILFLMSLLTVVRILDYRITLISVIVVVLIFDKDTLKKVDYSLILTFIGFFIFIGNMSKISIFCELLQSIINSHEVITSIIASQIISNVPTALLLSGFTTNYHSLIIGTNIGGLGTLIASMASLISFKYIISTDSTLKKKYIIYFSVLNVIFLIILLLLHVVLMSI